MAGGFVIAMYLARWAVSDLRDRSRRAIRFKNAAEELVQNLQFANKNLTKRNGELLHERHQLRQQLQSEREQLAKIRHNPVVRLSSQWNKNQSEE